MVVYWYAENIKSYLLSCSFCGRKDFFDTEHEAKDAAWLHTECGKVSPVSPSLTEHLITGTATNRVS